MEKDLQRARKALDEYRSILLRELNSLDHVLECSLENYDSMIDFAIEKGFERVVDIGCAYGHQAELCKGRIRYKGINEDTLNFYFNHYRKITYEVEKYPFPNPYNCFKEDLAISNLAIGWQCYVNENECRKQFQALSKDFKASLLYLPAEREELLKECFKYVEVIKKNDGELISSGLYYCYN